MMNDLKRHYAKLIAAQIADRQQAMDTAVAEGDVALAAKYLGEKRGLDASKEILATAIQELDIEDDDDEDDEQEGDTNG